MQPDRQVEIGERREQRRVGQAVERLAGERGEDLDAAGAELRDGARGLGDRAVDVGCRHRGDEAGEAVRVLGAQFRHGVIADAREPRAGRARGDVLDRRVRERDDLAVVAEGVHLAKAFVEVEQLGDGAQPLA